MELRNAPIRVGVSAVIIRDGAILLVEFDDESGPHFNLPGGGLEPGESIHEALQREVREETCAEVTVGQLLIVSEYFPPRDNHLYGSRHSLSLVFRCVLKPGSEPRLPECPDPNEVAVRWIPISGLAEQRLPGAVHLHRLLQGSEPPDLFHADWSLGLYR